MEKQAFNSLAQLPVRQEELQPHRGLCLDGWETRAVAPLGVPSFLKGWEWEVDGSGRGRHHLS